MSGLVGQSVGWLVSCWFWLCAFPRLEHSLPPDFSSLFQFLIGHKIRWQDTFGEEGEVETVSHLCPGISPAPDWLVGRTQSWVWCHQPAPGFCSMTAWCWPTVAPDTGTMWPTASRWWDLPAPCLPSAVVGETGQGWMRHIHRCRGTGSPAAQRAEAPSVRAGAGS